MGYLEKLNDRQRQAVEHGTGPLLVIAGAGSGKTSTLAHRVAHLLVQGADPRRILLMTFSRRAAAELTRRVERIAAAAEIIRSAERPMIVAGGGVIYSGASEALARFVANSGIPVCETQAGKGSLLHEDPRSVGAVGSTGTTAANALASEADVIIGIGTRYSDFTSASRTAFNNPDVRFVNINVASLDSVKQGGISVVSDAREALEALTDLLGDYSVSDEYSRRAGELMTEWNATVSKAYRTEDGAALNQNQVIGLVNTLSDPRDIVVCAAGSMPGDLHKLWRMRDRKGYHVEYGFSCMGYEIAGGIGVRMAAPDRDVFVMVGDGSYLMMATEIATAVQEGVKVIPVLVQNHGFASIGSLSESLGSQRFGTNYRFRDGAGRLEGATLPIDLAANAASLGADVIRATTAAEFADAVAQGATIMGLIELADQQFDQIAALAEVSPRTYSRYFATKEAVFLTLLEELSEEIALELRRLPRGIGPLEALRAAHVSVLTRTAAGGVGRLTSERVVLILRIINSADALRQSAFDFRNDSVVAALADQMGVPADDQRMLLGLSLFSAIIIAACGDLVADDDGTALGPLVMADRLNRACRHVAGFAGELFSTDNAPADLPGPVAPIVTAPVLTETDLPTNV